MSKRRTQRNRENKLTTIQIDINQASKLDAAADQMGVSRSQVMRWAIEYFDLELFLTSSFLKETDHSPKQQQAA